MASFSIKRATFASMEKITRPSAAERLLQRVLDRRPPDDDDGPADLRWGKPSNIDLTVGTFWGIRRVTTRTIPADDDPADELPAQIIYQYQEVDRDVEQIRVENPDDSEQYVMVDRALAILLQGPDDAEGNQVFIQLNFVYPS